MHNEDNNTVAKKIAAELATKIAEGIFQPGERLVENDLTDYFNVSRSPVRESLFILENQGIVEKTPRKGVRVREITSKEIYDLYDVVYNLTELSLKTGMEMDNQSEIADMRYVLAEMKKTVKDRDVKRCHFLVENLHYKLIQVSENKILEDLYKSLNMRWTTFRYLTLSHPLSLHRSVSEYEEIVSAFENKQFELIVDILQRKKQRGVVILENIISD